MSAALPDPTASSAADDLNSNETESDIAMIAVNSSPKGLLTEEQQKHPSETALDNYSNVWRIVANYPPIETLRKTAENLYERIKNDN